MFNRNSPRRILISSLRILEIIKSTLIKMLDHQSDEELSEELREHRVDNVDLNAEMEERASEAQS